VKLGEGRPRKPTAAKKLAGTLRKDRANPDEPQGTPVAMPDAPADLNKFERAAWDELKRLVDPRQVAIAADVYAFRRMVEVCGMLAALRKSFADAKWKPVIAESTKAGVQLRIHPAVQAIPTYEKLAMLHLARWGLSPAERSKVSVLKDGAPKKDKLEKFRLKAV
jgi:hypothetical protein